MPRVVHLTSVHHPGDVRIFKKECLTLVKNGYEVTLIAPFNRSYKHSGVEIKAVKIANSRFARILITPFRLLFAALSENAVIYHFHDPELIHIGIILKILGKNVVYDVHEDNVLSIKQKKYLSKISRLIISYLILVIESFFSKFFNNIIAEKCYRKRFIKAIGIYNYPNILEKGEIRVSLIEKYKLIYTGNVTEDRGCLVHANIVNEINDLEIHFVGKCSYAIADEIYKIAGPYSNKVIIDNVGEFVPHDKIVTAYKDSSILAGLAIFPKTPHYYEKELTKLFEYMMFGIPVICSDFPVWRKLIADNRVGVCVDPSNSKEIISAINYLRENPSIAIEMGERGRSLIVEKYNWSVEEKKLLKLYFQIINGIEQKP